MIAVHPGHVLKRELAARDLSADRLALALRLPSGRITDILNGKRGFSPDTALRLGRFSATAPASGSTSGPPVCWPLPRKKSATA
jgi:addiction module HigA family antidote